jgi:HEAT repeat protein
MRDQGETLRNDDHPEEYLERGIRLLVSRAISDRDPLTRKHSIYLLSIARSPDDINTFIQALRDPEKQVRSQATRALALVGEPAFEEIITLLKDPDWRVRYRAAEALGMLKLQKAGNPLIECLSDDNDHVRYMAVKALGQLGDETFLESVRPCLHDDNPYVRNMAASILRQL